MLSLAVAWRIMRVFIILLFALLGVTGCDPGPKEKPDAGELAGTYELSSGSIKFLESRKGYKSIPKSEIILRGDGTTSVIGLPDCYIDRFGEGAGQFLVGEGQWEIDNTVLGYGITLRIGEGGTMKAAIYHGSSILIKGRVPPFKLRIGVGDPDQGEYIIYEKTSS